MKSLSFALFLSILSIKTSFAYDHQVSGVRVGMVRAFGNYGFEALTRADGGAFPGCASDPGMMWIDSNFLTQDGAKAVLAVLLSAKLSGTPVTIYYTTADSYCRLQIVDIENTG